MYGYAPAYAQGGIASLAAKGRGGDSMLVHMSPDEVRQLQRFARAQGMTLTINPETGLPEAFSLRKLFRSLATLAPIAAALFPPLAAAMPFLATPLGAGVAGGIAGGLSGERGFDLKRGLMGGALSYGLSSAAQGLRAAGAPGGEAAALGGAQSFTPAEVAAMSPQAQAAIASAPVAAPFSPADATSFLAAQEAGLSAAPSLVPPSSGSISQGIGNLLSGDAATRAAAQKAFSSQFGRGAMTLTGIGALGTASLAEQEAAAKAAREAGRISQAEYEKAMAEIAETRRRNQYIVQKNPFRFRSGGAIDRTGKPIKDRPVRFFEGGDGDDGDDGGGGFGGDDGGFGDSPADADDAAAGAAMGEAFGGGDDGFGAAADAEDAAMGAAMSGALGGDSYGGMDGSVDGGLAAAAAEAAAANSMAGFAEPGTGGDFGNVDPFGGYDAGVAAAEAAAADAAAAEAASIGSMGDGGSSIPLSILLDSPMSELTPRKKKWEEMTPEEQEIERRRYMILQNPFQFKKGGIASLPPRYINGAGDGMSDSVPATINNKQPARLADGEFVIPADVVSHLGNGSSKAGAKQLYAMMDRVRKARTGTVRQGKSITPSKYMPA